MLHILLMILKLLGIILLALLSLLLFITAIVLFVPIHYKVKGSYFKQPSVKATASWLLHIVHFSVCYEEDRPSWKLRVFGIPLKKGNLSTDNEDKVDEKGIAVFEDELPKKNILKENPMLDVRDSTKFQEENSTRLEENTRIEDKKEEKTSLKKTLGEVIGKVIKKVKDTFEKIKSLKEKTYEIYQKLRAIGNWWNLETTGLAFIHCKKELWILLKHIVPRKYNVDLRFGTGDPASTGQILGMIGVIYPVTKGQLRITPEFQEKLIEGTFDLKGRVYVFKLLAIAWRIFWDKNVRHCYMSWKKRAVV